MVQVIVKTNGVRKNVSVEIDSTPKQVFANADVDVSGMQVSLNGDTLSVADLNTSLEQLGVADGQSVSMNAVVKADGAY